MEREELLKRLLGTFLGELDDHVRAFERDLLALEKGPPPEARPGLLSTLFRTAHSLKGAARSVSVPAIEGACHELEAILADLRDGRRELGPELLQLFYQAADAVRDAGRRLREGQALAGAPIEEIAGRLAAASAGATPLPVPPPPVPEERGRIDEMARTPSPAGEAVRIPSSKLDRLLARTGELLVARRRTEAREEELALLRGFVERWSAEWRAARKSILEVSGMEGPGRRAAGVLEEAPENLRRLSRDLDRLSTGLAADRRALDRAGGSLDEEIRSVRLSPFSGACEGLERAARDLAKSGAKEVELAVLGGETEADRAVLAALRDPLLHLVRNAVDHGIETQVERAAAGKPARGRVTVRASLRGDRLVVAVEDDGRGLDLAAVREAARSRGLAVPGDDRELARLVFLPGFSTAPAVTRVSGRGIGLDIVRSRAEALHGTVDLDFAPGKGTRLALEVPIALSTVRALLVEAGGGIYALAGTNVRSLHRAGPADLASVEGRDVLLAGGRPVPLAFLADLVGVPARERAPGASSSRIPVVVVASGEREIAVAVDELASEQELVVKPLGRRLAGARFVAGGAVLANGRIALLLSAADLVRASLGETPARRVQESLAVRAGPAPKRLLVAEDSVTTRTLLASILGAAGYEVVACPDGQAAWEEIQDRGADLVVTDVDMPRMDGFELARTIRGSRRFRDLPVVLVTALESDRDRARGIEVGADAYLRKSAFDQRELLAAIGQLL